ncbi:Mucin-1 [Chelonia mydas]|uniref:Mucin-1 n=1 Tax=Chelonia mydas TaxID=8469 RepID=M7BHA4_CHEMY|nr:Mucin-1 [Chelonia mydas]
MKPRSLSTDALRLGLVLLLLATVVIRISLSFRIVNRIFDNSLLDPNSINYLKLQVTIQIMPAVGRHPVPLHPSEKHREEQGSQFYRYKFAHLGASTPGARLGHRPAGPGLHWAGAEHSPLHPAGECPRCPSLRPQAPPAPLTAPTCVSASFIGTSSPTSAPAPLVPGWGIALLVLVCIGLVLSILLFILLIVSMCCRRNRGKLDMFSSQASYQPMSK